MRLTVLGCSGTFPGPDAPCSSYLIEAEGFRLLLDLGSGALGSLQRHVDLLDVDALVLSHLHGDHWLDAAPYAFTRSYHPTGPAPRLPLLAPGDARDRLALAQGGVDSVDRAYELRALAPGSAEVGPFALTFARMSHPVETYGVRASYDGRTLAYSADTGPTGALVELARDADAMLCEASFPEGADHPPDLHLTGSEAGAHAAGAAVGRLLLTHIVPWGNPRCTLDAAKSAYDGPLELVQPDAHYDI